MMRTDLSRETAKQPRLRQPARTVLRLAWVVIFVLYAAVYVIEWPVVTEQYYNLTAAALSMGFQQWSQAGLRAAMQAADLSPVGLAAFRLAIQLLETLGFASLGLLLFWRRSDEWIGLFTSLFLITFGFGAGYSLAEAPPALAGLLGLMVGLPWFGFYLFFFIYPDGHFVPRWTALWSVLLLAIIVYASLFPVPKSAPVFFLVFVFFSVPVLAQGYRYARAADAVQRAQIRWMVFAVAVIAGIEIIGQGLVPALFPILHSETPTGLLYGLFLTAGILLFLTLPAALTIAVLRYRLWDIDVLIRRTLVYALLTALLALAYFGSVVVLQNTFSAFTGQSQSTLVTVLSTLVIAALFVPLRGRVQNAIDRRFFRNKYDAGRTLAAFGSELRDETNLEALTGRLMNVVDDALQPETVALWLNPKAGAVSPAQVAESP